MRLRRPDLAVGMWVVGVWALDLRGSREERRLVMAAVEVDGTRALVGDDAEQLVLGALENSEELDQQRELMARLKAQGKSETVLRMHQGKLKRREEELQVRMQELAKTPRFDVEEHEVCSLLLLNEVGVVES